MINLDNIILDADKTIVNTDGTKCIMETGASYRYSYDEACVREKTMKVVDMYRDSRGIVLVRTFMLLGDKVEAETTVAQIQKAIDNKTLYNMKRTYDRFR